MWDFIAAVWPAVLAVPWWFYGFAVLALVQKPLVRIVKRWWGGGVY